jgi:hypothetical protein
MVVSRDGDCNLTLPERRSLSASPWYLQAIAVLVCGKDLDRLVWVLRGLLGNSVGELFLNAAASSGVADFWFFGRGFWIDQPIAFKASQPRCGATDAKPSSPAIQAATLRLDHRPPSGGVSSRRTRNFDGVTTRQ